MTEKLQFEMQDHTALITINNPAANTWDADNLQALEADQRSQCRSQLL